MNNLYLDKLTLFNCPEADIEFRSDIGVPTDLGLSKKSLPESSCRAVVIGGEINIAFPPETLRDVLPCSEGEFVPSGLDRSPGLATDIATMA